MPTLDEIESRLQTLLEIHLLKYLPGRKTKDRIYQDLAVAMHNSIREQDGITYAPDLYVIIAHPSLLARWRNEPGLIKEFAHAVYTAGDEAGFHFAICPTVTTSTDLRISVDEVRIVASFSGESVAETKGMPSEPSPESSADATFPNAFLIMNGTKVIAINQPVINIGRRLDNQIVIDDSRVSRAHAQLRVTKGRFVLFDLNSSGGTFVNGQRTNQSFLSPGDVISLAGVTFIFGQEPLPKSDPKVEMTEPTPITSTDRSMTTSSDTEVVNKDIGKKI
jgi:hypothetical protein